MRRAALALPIVIALIVGVSCAAQNTAKQDAATVASTAAPGTSASPGTTAPEDFEAQATDFVNLNDMTRVREFFIDNKLGHLEAALAVANNPDGGEYPVGTIIQLVPGEAMVKRRAGFDPLTGDWEFFELKATPEGTQITERGPEVVNMLGMNCANCHALAEDKWDSVCEQNHGCMAIGVDRRIILALQESDPRPRR